MRRFITKVVLFFVPIPLVLGILLSSYKIIPFTGSISFDAKIYDLQSRGFDTLDNIAIGSSMTLNNLNTQVLSLFLDGESYYNVSSWGQTIPEDWSLLQFMVSVYRLHRVFIVSCCEDFGVKPLECADDVFRYLYRPDLSFLPLMAKYKLKRQFLNFDELYEASQVDTCTYDCLRFDTGGGVPLDVYGDDISESRWNHQSSFIFNPEENASYSALDYLCSFLEEHKVSLIFVNSPVRSTYYANVQEDVLRHIEYTESIVTNHGGTYINELDYTLYPDSLFCDCCHLNRHGAEFLTQRVCDQLSSQMR